MYAPGIYNAKTVKPQRLGPKPSLIVFYKNEKFLLKLIIVMCEVYLLNWVDCGINKGSWDLLNAIFITGRKLWVNWVIEKAITRYI